MFKYLLKLFEKRDIGIELDKSLARWEVQGIKDYPSLFKNLGQIIPDDSVLYFEGGSPSNDLLEFLQKNKITDDVKIKFGTIFPRPTVYKIPATNKNLRTLSKITEGYAEPEVAVHFHVYKDDKLLVEWFDAFFQSMLLSSIFSEKKVQNFTKSIGATYK
ncbi:hypothetical protein GF362_02130 [Candidatus Dojkabacteria bacterium]|nr:hypothetical protein [Candidatus Dojkabacteria bacterium]